MGIMSTGTKALFAPRRMIEPLPKSFSICNRARSMALFFSVRSSGMLLFLVFQRSILFGCRIIIGSLEATDEGFLIPARRTALIMRENCILTCRAQRAVPPAKSGARKFDLAAR